MVSTSAWPSAGRTFARLLSSRIRSSSLSSSTRTAATTSTEPKAKVVFCCSPTHFVSAYEYTKAALQELMPGSVAVVQAANDARLADAIADATVIIPYMARITPQLLDRAPQLRMVMQFGVGLEGVDVQAATARGVWVCNIPDGSSCGNAQSCAEHALYLALAVLRDQQQLARSLATGVIGWPTGRTLFQATVLIYGFGGIGQQLAKRLAGFDARVYAVTRTLPAPAALPHQEHLEALGGVDAFAGFAKDADVVFICCAQNSGNVGLVDSAFIAQLKPGAVVVNVARGGLLNYGDVLEALHAGRLAGVGIDVYHTEPFPNPSRDPFLAHPRVVATPHVAGVTHVSYANMGRLTAANVQRVLTGQTPLGAVNEKEVAARP